jgi:hypothetical protein
MVWGSMGELTVKTGSNVAGDGGKARQTGQGQSVPVCPHCTRERERGCTKSYLNCSGVRTLYRVKFREPEEGVTPPGEGTYVLGASAREQATTSTSCQTPVTRRGQGAPWGAELHQECTV